MATLKNAWLVYQPDQAKRLSDVQDCAQHLDAALEPVELNDFVADPAKYLNRQSHVICLLESAELGQFLRSVYQLELSIGLLPVHAKSKVCRLYDIPSSLEDALPLALQGDSGTELELLFCNDEVVTWMVILGEAPFIELRKIAYQQELIWRHLLSIPSNIMALFRLKPKAMTVVTAKDTKIKTALMGAVVMENDVEGLVSHFANEPTSTQDGKLYAVFVAPSSIMDYFSFVLSTLTPKPRLPRAINYIKTANLTLEGASDIQYWLDGKRRDAKQIVFKIIPKAIHINVGPGFVQAHKPLENDKDTMKVENLPQGEERLKRLNQKLPFFSNAREEDFREVFTTLRDYTSFSANFALFMVLSSMLATFGLFLNSAPVVIGAMILAPLMGPLVSLSMGILRNDTKFFKNALQVFILSTVLTLLVAAFITLIMPYEQPTAEIRARLQPNLLDLGVAIVSGIAAAFAHARESIQKSLPGVAIAVALVPPACVMGVGLGWMDWGIISGAGLLFLANLAGIVLAAMFAFLCLGFAPASKANRGLGFSLILTLLVSVPLYHSLMNTVVYQRLEKKLSTQNYEINGKSVTLSEVYVEPVDQGVKIMAQLHSPEVIQASDVASLKSTISEQLNEAVELDVSLRLVQ